MKTATTEAGEAFAALIEDEHLTSGYALALLDAAEAAGRPVGVIVPGGYLSVEFRDVDSVTLRTWDRPPPCAGYFSLMATVR